MCINYTEKNEMCLRRVVIRGKALKHWIGILTNKRWNLCDLLGLTRSTGDGMSESTYCPTNAATNKNVTRHSSNSLCSLRSLWFLVIGGVLFTMVYLSTPYMNIHEGRIFKVNFTDFMPKFRAPSLRYKYRQKPIILAWTGFFSKKIWLKNMTELDCPVDCQVTHRRDLLDNSSAVILHLRDVDIRDLPFKGKSSSQMWVLLNHEAPPHTSGDTVRALNGKIHWTATYRADSDFFVPYGIIVPLPKRNVLEDSLGFPNKSKLVCWVVSHCTTPSRREQYVKDLGEHVPIAIYGQCGHNTCPNASAKYCYEHISKDCKFYLSFENSICRNYVTEKLFYALQTDMVPIVMGGENYSQILPENSFINVLDYNSPKDLAQYLLKLDRDPLLYKKYHRWKQDYEAKNYDYRWMCDLCQRLYYDDLATIRPHENLHSWWYDESHCQQKQ